MFKSFIFALILVLSCTSSFAGSLAEAYRSETKKVILKLKSLGVTQIACTLEADGQYVCQSPESLLAQLESIKFVELEKFKKPPGATRWDAFYTRNPSTVYLNRSSEQDIRFIGYIGLHELLGTMLVLENNFGISMMAYQLISNAEAMGGLPAEDWYFDSIRSLVENFFTDQSQYKIVQNNILVMTSSGGPDSGGGGVVVGGGAGDTITFGIRAELFRRLSHHLLSEIGDPFSTVPIEVVDKNDTAINYKMSLGNLEQIRIPRNLLSEGLKNAAQVNAVIEDVLWFLNSRYPNYAGIPYKIEQGVAVPQSLEKLHPQSIEKVWCSEDLFTISICPLD